MRKESPRPLALGSWRDVLGADVRTLAALRILLAVSVLADLSIRASDLRAFYTDAGILPRAAVLEQFAWFHELAPSLHLVGGSTWSQVVLFSIQALAALCMLVGYRTRGATFVVWLLVSSLQLRNLYIGAGVDALLRMLLLWGIFLPLGARWSVDGLHRLRTEPEQNQVVSVATIALLVQVGFVYGAAGLAKLDVPAWREGGALAMILNDDVRTTALGAWVGDQAWLCAMLEQLVLAVEIGVAMLLFVPLAFGLVRTIAVGLFVAMDAGFFVTLNVGLFPWVAVVGALALLPRWFWQTAHRALARFEIDGSRLHELLVALAARLPPARTGPTRTGAIARESVCAVLLAFVVLFNFGVVRDPAYRPPGSIEWIGRSLFLQQAWKMFARPATRTGWISIEGQLRGAGVVDLMAAGGPVPSLADAKTEISRPDPISDQYRNDRWRSLLSGAVRGVDTAPQFRLYGRYLCRQWNSAHTGDDQLLTFRLLWHMRDLAAEIQPAGDYSTQTLWRHSCFG